MRQGVALLVTLGIISAISVVIATSFELVNRGFEHIQNVEKVNQTAVVVRDIEKVMAVLIKNIDSSDTLSMLLGAYPPLFDEEGRFSLTIELQPIYTGININSILDKVNKKEPLEPRKLKEKYIPVFEYIFNFYQVKDGEMLLNYILDTIDLDVVERSIDTELALQDVSKLQGLILTKEAFFEILREYQTKYDDDIVLEIPWEDFFTFGYTSSETVIDCNFMKLGLVKALEMSYTEPLLDVEESDDTEVDEVSCDMIKDEANKEIKSKYLIREFKKNSNYRIRGKIEYLTNSVTEEFAFIYDFKTKRIISLEVE